MLHPLTRWFSLCVLHCWYWCSPWSYFINAKWKVCFTHNMHKHTHLYTHNCDSLSCGMYPCVCRTWSQLEQKHNKDGWSRRNDGRDSCKQTWLKQISLVAPRGDNAHYTLKYKSVARNEEHYAYFAIPRDLKVKIRDDHCGVHHCINSKMSLFIQPGHCKDAQKFFFVY